MAAYKCESCREYHQPKQCEVCGRAIRHLHGAESYTSFIIGGVETRIRHIGC